MRNRGKRRMSLCGTGVEDSPARSAIPARWCGGMPTRCPRLDTQGFRQFPTARPPAGKGILPLHSPTRVPLDPVP